MKDGNIITIRDIEELNCIVEEVLQSLKKRKDMPKTVKHLKFKGNRNLQNFTYAETLAISLDEIKKRYLQEILPIAREVCRTDLNIYGGLTISDEVDDDYLDDLIAFKWKKELQEWADRWEREWKRKKQISTLTFNFNEKAVSAAGLTTDELLEDMRSYAMECGIEEISYGVFLKSGPDSLAMLLGFVVRKADSDPDFINYLDSWLFDCAGNIEDCKVEILRIERKKRMGKYD